MLFMFLKISYVLLYLFMYHFCIKGFKENIFERTSIFFSKWIKETNIWSEPAIIFFLLFQRTV